MSELRGRRVRLRTIASEDAPRLREIHATAPVAAWWGTPEPGFPQADDPEAIRFAIWVDDQLAGMIQFSEERDPDHRHATVDMFLAPELHNRGLGADALATLVAYLIGERGHHRITIDPAADNRPAIRCYEKVGFRRVGVMRSAERRPDGRWQDVLLLELVTVPPSAQ
jgi:aminoglycoside 6'-N-acetyltransferase